MRQLSIAITQHPSPKAHQQGDNSLTSDCFTGNAVGIEIDQVFFFAFVGASDRRWHYIHSRGDITDERSWRDVSREQQEMRRVAD